MSMPVASMSAMRREPKILEPLADGARALARVLQVVAHQAVEADVARALAREQLAIGRMRSFVANASSVAMRLKPESVRNGWSPQ